MKTVRADIIDTRSDGAHISMIRNTHSDVENSGVVFVYTTRFCDKLHNHTMWAWPIVQLLLTTITRLLGFELLTCSLYIRAQNALFVFIWSYFESKVSTGNTYMPTLDSAYYEPFKKNIILVSFLHGIIRENQF